MFKQMVIDDWELFSESPLPVKGEFYNNLNMKDVTYSDYNHAKRICKDFEISKFRNMFLAADVFQNFRKMGLEIYELDPAKFLSTPILAW